MLIYNDNVIKNFFDKKKFLNIIFELLFFLVKNLVEIIS